MPNGMFPKTLIHCQESIESIYFRCPKVKGIDDMSVPKYLPHFQIAPC